MFFNYNRRYIINLDAADKFAVFENGIAIMIPQFIKAGDIVRIDVEAKNILIK